MKTATLDRLHGIALIALMSLSAFYIAGIPEVKALSLSPLIVGIIIGMIYANTLRCRMPKEWEPGIKFCTKRLLRLGIIFYGFRLTLSDVAAVGLPAVIIVAGTLLLGLLFSRWIKLDRDTALLTSTGSAICGAAAVLGAEPVVRCESHKTAIAVSTVVVFGTLSMFIYPIMYRAGLLDGLSYRAVAIYTGSTLHEVAHVAGAGNAMDPPDALGINTLLQHLCGAATVKDIPLNGAIEYADTFMLTMAMTALGTDTGIDKFRQAGAKPFLLAAMLYVWLIVGGYFITQAVTAAF